MDFLNTGKSYRLVLVINPRGSGRTKLLREWASRQAEGGENRVAWLYLEEADNQPEYFLAHLDRVLRPALPPSLFQPDPTPLIFSDLLSSQFAGQTLEDAITERINSLAQAPGGLILILEDYEVITSTEIHQTIGLLLDYLPPQALVLIACTSEPPLPLARLRVRRQLLELTFEDLV